MLEKAIKLWNPWWVSGKVRPDVIGIPRDITSHIIGSMGTPHIKDIVGVRRCGKTTILKQIIANLITEGTAPKDALLLNFDDVQISRAKFVELERAMDRINPDIRYLFVDEVQQKEDWERWVRTLYDTGRFEQIFVTGSSSSVLSTDIGRVLTGRHVTSRVLPFSFKEYLMFKGWEDFDRDFLMSHEGRIAHHLLGYLSEGGFPETIGRKEHERKVIHTNLFNDIIARDVVSRHGSSMDRASDMAYHLISNVGKEYSLRRISNALGISMDASTRYLGQLMESELLHNLSLFSYKLKHQFKQNKKMYCVDNGLMNSVSFTGEDIARSMENSVLMEFIRRGKDVYYWKGERQKEVDFVLKERPLALYQICMDLRGEGTRRREFGSLQVAMDHLDIDEGTIITLDDEGEERVDGGCIKLVPLWRLLLDI